MQVKKPRILFCAYRDWACNIYHCINASFQHLFDIELVQSREESKTINPDLYEFILFVGWSWIIPQEMVETGKCICFHPSPLPKYRGGSPIQHQIINGEEKSAVTLFIMDSGIDTGPLLLQEPFSLIGELDDVLENIRGAGVEVIKQLLGYYLVHKKLIEGIPQNESLATSFKRRKQEESEITLNEIKSSTATELYNKIRCLQDPYPNAFIRCGDGSKLFITRSHL